MNVTSIKTRVFREDENLISFITEHVRRISERSVLIVTSKIVALAEGRVRVVKNKRTREELIRSESQWAMRTKYTWLTIKDGMVMSSAGVDESNANGKIILLPKDSFKTARDMRKKLKRFYRVQNLGVMITDSRLLPLRAGVVGVALGYAGFKGVRDYRGTPDLFGRTLRLSRTDIADSLATAAVLLMGEGAERQPLALISEAPVEFTENTHSKELAIDIREDIYQPLFEKIRHLRLTRSRKQRL